MEVILALIVQLSNYEIVSFHQSVQNFVQTCRTCSFVKPKYIDPTSMPMLAKAPMEVVACDFIGPILSPTDMYADFPNHTS